MIITLIDLHSIVCIKIQFKDDVVYGPCLKNLRYFKCNNFLLFFSFLRLFRSDATEENFVGCIK